MKAKKKPASKRVGSNVWLEFAFDLYHPSRVMTRDEYDTMKLTGLHAVCHDYDGFGNTAIWLSSNAKVNRDEQR